MPYMNVLDLSIFPEMSCRHIKKSRDRGRLRVLREDNIWEVATEVWNQLPYAKVASGYIQAYRITAEMIKAKGDKNFLGVGGTPHVGVRSDFKENATRSGLTRKDGHIFL